MDPVGVELEDFRERWKDEIRNRRVNPTDRQVGSSKRSKKSHQQRESFDIWPQSVEQVGRNEPGVIVGDFKCEDATRGESACGLIHGEKRRAAKEGQPERHKSGTGCSLKQDVDTIFESSDTQHDAVSSTSSGADQGLCYKSDLSHRERDRSLTMVPATSKKRTVTPEVDSFYIAESLLEGRTSPLQSRIEEEKSKSEQRSLLTRHQGSDGRAVSHHHQKPRREDLVDVLIQDLNEINEIPFFDIELPYELALKIFQYLGRTELGRCAQVSKTWKVLAEDEVLWYRLCQKEGHHPNTDISEYPCWKAVLRDCRNKECTLTMNWKNRVGAVSQLQYELGKVLCDVHSCDGVVLAGYTSGDVRLWDARTWDCAASYLEPTLAASEPGLRPHVSFVRINSMLAAAAYEDGTVDVWGTMFGREPIHHFQHNQGIQALAVGSEVAAVATASGSQVRVESPDEKGYWKSAFQCDIQKQVNFLQLVPDSGSCSVAVVTADDTVCLLKPHEEARTLHSVYGHPVTSLDVSSSLVAFGVRSFGWLMNDGNKVLVHCLKTGQCLATLGNSAGDFTCINLRDSPPNLLVTGNKDRRVRMYDLRTNKSVNSLYSHHLGVSCVQMDDWKVVSGGMEGLVCVWDWRMGAKLWEIHARHPVRHIRFNAHILVTANIPDEKCPRGASIMDDDLTAHRRHRGTIYVYDFLMDRSTPESILPICRSSYNESTGYSYNIALAVPYDDI